MSGIVKVPVKYKQYYTMFVKAITDKMVQTRIKLEKDIKYSKVLREEIKEYVEDYKTLLNIEILKEKDFAEEKHINGKLLNIARSLFINNDKQDAKVSNLIYILFKYAKTLENISIQQKQIQVYDKCLAIDMGTYKEVLRIFSVQLHKKLILEGCGYAFSGKLGWICINRVKVTQGRRKKLDYKATNLKKKELLENNVELYDAEKAKWCEARGLEYHGADYRVYKDVEYLYEVPLIHCMVPNAKALKFRLTNTITTSLTGKSHEELIELCNRDKEKICELNIGLRIKLVLCDAVDKKLYLNFIRNENQKTYALAKVDSKNRQRLQHK